MTGRDGLLNHLETGSTTVCHAWLVTRTDGQTFGFTDHDSDLRFAGDLFKASSGLSAGTLQQATGLSVDNSEALGALSDVSVSEDDLAAGRFDGAQVEAWLVNWANVDQRMVEFRGSFGEVTRKAGAFRVELRGQTERLNQPQGRVYQPGCSAVLGDARCQVDLTSPSYRIDAVVGGFDSLGRLQFSGLPGFEDRWFERGTLTPLSGVAQGLSAMIKADRSDISGRIVELWQGFGTGLAAGDAVRLQTGCDKRAATCRVKFLNFLNFRGFPHIPGEDWLAAYPVSTGVNDGGSLAR